MPDGELILLVDDDADVIRVIREFLEGRGHEVQVARTGAEALAALDASAFELVLLDLRLPDVDTATLLREVPRRPDAPDVIVITGYPALDSAITALETGAVGYFVKPFDFPRLDEAIGKVLGRRRLARDNARLHAEIADRLRETEALFAISSTLTSTLDVREALRRTCRELARLTGAETVSVHLHDGAADRLMPVAAYHVPKRYLETLAQAPLTLKDQDFYLSLWKERRPVHSDDVVHDPRFAGTLFRAFPHQSGLLLPLSLDEEVAGAFYLVWWTARRRFTERELVPLESICGQVSLLLRNARLFEQTERDRRRLQTLHDVASQLSAVHDTEHVLSLIVHEASQLLGGEAAVLRLLEGDELVVAAQSALAGPLVHRPRLKVGVGFGGRIVATGEPLVVGDLSSAAPAVDREFSRALLDEGIHAFVGVPLKANGRPAGTLSVYGRRARQVSADEVALLQAFADQASLAIEKAALLGRAEEARSLLTRIFDSTSDGIVLVDRAGRVLSSNRRIAELLAVPVPDGTNFPARLVALDARGPDGARGVVELRALLADLARAGEGDIRLPGSMRTLHWVAQPATDATGDRVGYTLTFHDVTQEREVSQMKSDFVSFVTHQLRTPLTGIRWMLDLAAQEEHVSDTLAEFIGDARAAAQRLIGLVNDLLDVSKLEGGKLALSPRETRLGEVTESVLDELAGLARERGHRITVAGDGEVPPVMVDPQWLRQVILNLTSNAIKYTPKGGTITVQMGVHGAAVEWAIHDTGIGIPPEAQRRLFEKFYRADNAVTVETEGTGLGLYLVRLIVERFGGRVWCESPADGGGCTFRFTVPRPEAAS